MARRKQGKHIPQPSSQAVGTATLEVECDHATLSEGKAEKEGAVRTDGLETPSPSAAKTVGVKNKRGKSEQKNPAGEFAFKRETTVGTVERESVEKVAVPESAAKERRIKRDSDNQSCLAAEETPSPSAAKTVGVKNKRGKNFQMNRGVPKFKLKKVASAKFSCSSSFRLSRTSPSCIEPVETTAKTNLENEPKSIHTQTAIEPLPPSTPVEPWIVRERRRRKAAKRSRIERESKNGTWLVFNREILLCITFAAVALLAYCFF
ncbi:hypothetical protein ACTXT7_005302 [Hymenolepis weldensis]